MVTDRRRWPKGRSYRRRHPFTPAALVRDLSSSTYSCPTGTEKGGVSPLTPKTPEGTGGTRSAQDHGYTEVRVPAGATPGEVKGGPDSTPGPPDSFFSGRVWEGSRDPLPPVVRGTEGRRTVPLRVPWDHVLPDRDSTCPETPTGPPEGRETQSARVRPSQVRYCLGPVDPCPVGGHVRNIACPGSHVDRPVRAVVT